MSISEDTLALGRIEVSPAASAALAKAGADLETFLSRHRRGDWGDVEERDRQRNQYVCLSIFAQKQRRKPPWLLFHMR